MVNDLFYCLIVTNIEFEEPAVLFVNIPWTQVKEFRMENFNHIITHCSLRSSYNTELNSWESIDTNWR